MAEGGRPASERYRQGVVVSCDSTFSAEHPSPNSKTSVDTLTSSRRTETHHLESSSHICQEDQRDRAATTFTEPPSTLSSSCSTRETDIHSQEAGEKSGERHLQHLPDPRLQPPRAPGRPHSIAEAYPPPHHLEEAASESHHSRQAGGDAAQRLQPACLPVQRSHSDSVPLFKQGSVPQPPHGDTCGPSAYPVLDYGVQEPQGHATLACKQPMQLQQQYNLFTVTCGPPAPQQQQPHSQHEDGALCCGSYAHPGGPEDTFAAYCHPQPIPGPTQTLPHGAGTAEADRRDQRMALSSQPVPGVLGLPPRLMSSVSETGLDAKRMLHCNCSWVSSLPPGVVLQSQQQQQQQQQQRSGLNEVCSGPVSSTSGATRDIGTMTAHRQLVDSGVQTEQSPPPHVFPQVCLVEENGNTTDGNHNKKTSESGESGGSSAGKSSNNAQKSPVKEVKWDAEGMTWEVYGASVDPEELGLAIQRHLELQIKETAGRAAKLCRQDTNTSRQSVPAADSRRRKRSRMMGSIRTPTCCARSSTAVD